MSDALQRATASFFLCVALMAVPSVAWTAVCAQPVSETGSPTIKDCVYIARSSISELPCATCVCDANGSGDVRITDALRCLWFVVGGEVSLDCPPCDDTSTTTLPGCASCNDVLTGVAEVEDLCEFSRIVYDDMKACPRESCPQECGPTPPLCWHTQALSTAAPVTTACMRCLYRTCLQTVATCAEN